MSDETTLYRAYSESGELLYVGISFDALARFKSHLKHSKWTGQCASLRMERFSTRQEAIAAERDAIKQERPRFNVMHSVSDAIHFFTDEQLAEMPRRDETPKIMRLPEVIQITGLSRSTIYAMMDGGLFPRAVKISVRAIGWPSQAIYKWLDRRLVREFAA